jgi:hypothetical protein
MRRVETVKPVTVQATIDDWRMNVDGTDLDTTAAASERSQDNDADEAVLRRRSRGHALLLMVLSGVFVIAVIVVAWLMLRG